MATDPVGEATTSSASVVRVASLLIPIAIVIACWIGSNAAALAVFGVFEYVSSSSTFGDIIVRFFFWSLNALLAAGTWISVWMLGVLGITTWHRLWRR